MVFRTCACIWSLGAIVGSVQDQREVIVIRNVGEKDMPSQKP